MQRVFGESLRPGDRLRPLVFERRPRRAHALRVRRTEHRAQRVPRVTLVHVRRDVDAVDDNRVDQRVDVDVDEPGVADLHVGEVDVAEAGAAEIGAPEHGSRKIPLELFRHAASRSPAPSSSLQDRWGRCHRGWCGARMCRMETRSLSPKHADAPMVPIIGMGTSKTLDTDDLALAGEVVSAALDAGTTLFDSSPMYGKAERTLGAALEGRRSEAVVATKVWTDDDEVAERQIAASLSFYGGHIELLQIHNMVRWPERLRRIEELRDAGQVTLVGATHWKAASFDELEAAMVTGRLDAIQIPYNPREREVEDRLLPLAAELGLGVLIMRPFAAADLMRTAPSAAELAPLEPSASTRGDRRCCSGD